MAKYSPQTNYFNITKNLNKYYEILFWIIPIISFVLIFFKIPFINYISIIVIIALFVIEIFADNYRSKAERQRRLDLMDNSFGTKFIHDSSKEYFDNEELLHGTKKMFVNLFENTFYSYKISEEMKKRELVKNIILIIIVLCVAIYGFSKALIAIPVLQIVLSRIFVLKLIKINDFNSNVEGIFNEFKNIASRYQADVKNRYLFEVDLYKVLIEYETNVERNKLLLDSKIYNRFNIQLMEEWEEIKNKYFLKDSPNK